MLKLLKLYSLFFFSRAFTFLPTVMLFLISFFFFSLLQLYNELTLCFETLKRNEIQLQQRYASLQDQLLGKDQKICQLQEQLQQAHDALNMLHQNSSHDLQVRLLLE